MARYAVLLYERVPPEDLPEEVMQAHLRMPERVAELGGRIVMGLALEQPETATAIRGDLVTDGPFIETKEVLGGPSSSRPAISTTPWPWTRRRRRCRRPTSRRCVRGRGTGCPHGPARG
ncbi:hypothetical protein ABGB18_24975 [Nonomuraea sp. B12E4]|uniref:YciI family protein n=1 Tax=Nonomuraea sp. B12E4 TaxID=3153564 RepID=UPI00325EA359